MWSEEILDVTTKMSGNPKLNSIRQKSHPIVSVFYYHKGSTNQGNFINKRFTQLPVLEAESVNGMVQALNPW